jgi:hypothetical protein
MPKCKTKPKLTAKSVCRDCGQQREVPSWHYLGASAPRCYVCGGPMDRMYPPRK